MSCWRNRLCWWWVGGVNEDWRIWAGFAGGCRWAGASVWDGRSGGLDGDWPRITFVCCIVCGLAGRRLGGDLCQCMVNQSLMGKICVDGLSDLS